MHIRMPRIAWVHRFLHTPSAPLLLFRYEVVDRLVQGLSGLFLALRRRPVIRYQRNSEYARRLAESLYSLTYKQQVRGWLGGRPWT